MHFQAIDQVGRMFYNEKGQLCLRRFDFEAIRACPSATLNRWHVQKIFGDECHVFILKVPEASSCTEGFHQNQMRSKIPNDDERNLEGDREVVAGNKQHMSQSSLVAKTNANVPFMASVKSVAEKKPCQPAAKPSIKCCRDSSVQSCR